MVSRHQPQRLRARWDRANIYADAQNRLVKTSFVQQANRHRTMFVRQNFPQFLSDALAGQACRQRREVPQSLASLLIILRAIVIAIKPSIA